MTPSWVPAETFESAVKRRVSCENENIERLAIAIEKLAAAIESRHGDTELGGGKEPRYTRIASATPDLASERAMAELLRISERTLAEHRRRGRLPNCWVRNGRRISYRVAVTLAAWDRGIA